MSDGVGAGKTVVVINDSPELLELAEMLLREEDFDVKVAVLGHGSFELIRDTMPGRREPGCAAPGHLRLGYPPGAQAGTADGSPPGAGVLGGGRRAADAGGPVGEDGR